MLKKSVSIIFAAIMLNLSLLPAGAINELAINKPFILKTQITSDFDVNNSNEDDIVQFMTDKSIRDNIGVVIPKGTIFTGKIKEMEISRLFYRRAKARIEITEMMLPDGKTYKIQGETKRKFLKGSMAANIAKGAVGIPAAAVVGAAGGVIDAAEYVSIIGILLTGKTENILGNTLFKLTSGINCKKKMEDDVAIKIRYLDDEFYTDTIMRKTGKNLNKNSEDTVYVNQLSNPLKNEKSSEVKFRTAEK